MDEGRSRAKSNRHRAMSTPGNHGEDEAQPRGAERKDSSLQHPGMQARGKVFEKWAPITPEGPPELIEGPKRQSR